MSPKILVVDDHPETLDIITSVLAQHDFNVFSARSGFRGLSIAEQERPDLIMVDGMMPEMDGWEFCRRVRKLAPLAQTPIIMFSAEDDPRQKLAGFDAGADDYLTKPTEPDEMINRVHALLESAQSRKSQALKTPPPPSSAPETGQQPIVKVQTKKHSGNDVPRGSSRPLRKGQIIVVMGARGGVGTTTTAMNIATSIASLGHQTTLFDLDQTQGHVAVYLKQKVPREAKRLVTVAPHEMAKFVPSAILSWNKYLNIVPTRANLLGNYPEYSGEQALAICEVLSKPGSYLVVDAGRGVSPVLTPVLEQADRVLVCLRPERIALSAARRLMVLWQKALYPTTNIHPVIVDFEPGREIPQQAIESYLGRPLLGVIPIQPNDIVQSSNKGVPLVQLFEKSQTAVLFKQLTQKLVMA